MAKNWTISEAVAAVKANDTDAIQDLGKRYPLLLHQVTMLLAKAPEEAVALMGIMPEYVTANKLNKALLDGVDAAENDADVDDEDEQEEQPKKKPAAKPGNKKPAAKKQEPEDDEDDDADDGDAPFDENMSSKEMYALCGKLGLKKKLKDTKKPTMIAALKAYYAENGAEDADAEDDDDAAEENPYEGKKAIDLYNECKERGIKAKPKMKASYYVDLLVKDDEANADGDEDEGWDEADEEEEAPKKPAKKPAAKGGKPAAGKKAKKQEPEDDEDDADADDDDDNWDI